MEKINKFSPEVAQKLGYYVYRLIDPRNGQTFYVGKGKNNRVFAHAQGALNNYDGENYISKEDDEDEISAKYGVIREIKNAGLEVIHLIQRYGLTEKEAFEVESAVIDCFSNLTNIQSGHYAERGVTNAYTLQRNLSTKQYDEPANIKYIIIKTSWARVQFMQSLNRTNPIYEATRYCWRISKKNARKYKYVLGVIDGIVEGVYEPTDWQDADVPDRVEFVGKEADDAIKDIFLHKRIPDAYKGGKGKSAPVLYSKN